MLFILNLLWLLRTSKYVLFWLYLWQLKEYHIGRFLDHFRTHKGKRLILNPLIFIKILLFVLLLANSAVFSFTYLILFLIYLFESAIFIKAVALKTLKKPVKTGKILFLAFLSFAVMITFGWGILFAVGQESVAVLWLLTFDIFLPFIISAIVLIFQPFFVFARNKILKKASQKLKKLQKFLPAGRQVKIIAIAGSYGKTSTKEFLATILSEKFRVLKTSQHQNSEIGIANCILKDLNEDCQIFIAEVGAYDKGKVKEVCQMLKPKIGIVTGVNEQHLALFGSLENLLSAEGGRELLQFLEGRPRADLGLPSLLVVNGDNKYCLDLYKRAENISKKIYAVRKDKIDADIWTEDITVGKDAVSFVAINKNKEMAHFKASVLGKHNVQNLLAAILTARELGMSFEEIAQALKNIKPKQAGMVRRTGKYGIEIIDSSYSANPDGVVADLEYLKIFPSRKIVVMPCLIELGPKSGEIHEKIGRKIAEICDLAIITTKDKLEDIKRGAGAEKIIFLEKPDEIFQKLTTFCKSGDAVLLEGRVSAKLIKLLSNV